MLMNRYSEAQRSAVVAAQAAYRAAVADAWAVVDEANREKTRLIAKAEAERNAAVKASGVRLNDIRDIQR